MINSATDYAINKKESQAIVYCDAFGSITQLTQADFSSEEEFIYWKTISDEDYHEIEKEEHRYLDHVSSLEGLSEIVSCVDSIETSMINLIEEEEILAIRKMRKEKMMKGLEECLTEKQRVRLWLVCAEGMSTKDAAIRLGVVHSAISESVASAKKKIKKYFE